MSPADSSSVTRLLRAWGGGDEDALGRLVPLVYEELRRRARHHMARERPGITLQPTALVNEVYLRLVDVDVQWRDRAHFFAIAAQMMRRILVDAARARCSDKRGGGLRMSFDERFVPTPAIDSELLAVDEALEALARKDQRKAKVVELRFFGGLSLRETAEALKVSEDTVGRDWNFAKAWLAHKIK